MLLSLLAVAGLLAFQDPAPAAPVEASPETPSKLAEIRTRAQASIDAFLSLGHVPGVSAGIAGDGFELALAAGVRERGKEAPLQPDDMMCAGSTGKTFVAALLLQLVQEKKLELAGLAGDYLGEAEWFERLPNAPELTIENLMEHRSGLPRYVFKPEFMHDLVAQPDHVWKPEELLGYVLGDSPALAPGSGFAYSDTNYIVLGMIAEAVTGSTLYAEVQRRFLEPLRLTHVRPQDGRRIPGLVQGHAGDKDPLGFPERVIDERGQFFANPQFEWAGGGFVSSGGDLARWARALYGGTVLEPALRERMMSGKRAPTLGRGTAYGLGAIVWQTQRGPAVGHEGFFPGYMSEMRYWPKLGIAVAVQVNSSVFQDLGWSLGRMCDELLETALVQ